MMKPAASAAMSPIAVATKLLCYACETPFDNGEEELRCKVDGCSNYFHLACAGAAKLTAEEKIGWACPQCRCRVRREGDYSHTPVGTSKIRAGNVTIRKKIDPQESKTGPAEFQSLEFFEVMSEVQKIRKDMSEMKNMLGQVTATIGQYHVKLESLTAFLSEWHSRETGNKQEGNENTTTTTHAQTLTTGLHSNPSVTSQLATNIRAQPKRQPPKNNDKTGIQIRAPQLQRKDVTKTGDMAAGPSALTVDEISPPAPRPTTPPRHSEGDSSKPVDEDSGWTTVKAKSRPNRQRRQIVVGTGKLDDSIRAVERRRYIQAWSFKPDTTIELVLEFLNKIKHSENYLVQKREIKTSTHASFVIGIPESLWSELTDPAVWPQGVRFADWFPARPRQQRGNMQAGDITRKSE